MSNAGGRPTVITQSTVLKLEDAFKAGFTVSEACSVSGISRAAYYDHKANDVQFSDIMDRAKAWVTLQAKYVVVKAITADGDVPVAKWWLERKARNEFGTNAVNEDEKWEAQHTTDNKADDLLRQILDMMSDTSEAATDEAASEAPTAEQAALRTVTATKPMPRQLQSALPKATEAPHDRFDILSDLYDED